LPSPSGCIFCDYPLAPGRTLADLKTDEERGELDSRRAWDKSALVLTVRPHAFVVLNRFPYVAGHLMVVPRAHGPDLDGQGREVFDGVHELLHETVGALRKAYRPDGINVGMNMGKAAGAGLPDHAHYHVLPRWSGDTNFMPMIAHTRGMNEGLATTWETLAPLLRLPEDDAP
jgi:ATP adenylyltransferase